ncbi:MAG TPA: tyrosine--tRNA ligase [Nitrososphaerales archaeon]|nr:tyrosine--tRNA ligase [Nitrososphaerales archaeon]
MDLETRLEHVRRVGEEIITEPELRELLATNDHPSAYDGFEPSGLANIAFGVFRAANIADMQEAGVHFKLWVADWFAWLNGKMGGNLDKIQEVGRYFVEVWKASGVDISKVDVQWTSEAVKDEEYWKRVVRIAQNVTLARSRRAISIMGRTEKELVQTAQLFYPMMQVADIFWLDVDICQLGLDQRRANILAREMAEKFRWKRPVAVHHHMLMGLQGVKQPEGYDDNAKIDVEIASKMSKSKPETSIFVHDSAEEIRKKMGNAYCPAKVTVGNPVLEYAKYIVFRKASSLRVERPAQYGGPVEFASYAELESAFRKGELHPADLKRSVADAVENAVAPIRTHFENDPSARRLFESVKAAEVTR